MLLNATLSQELIEVSPLIVCLTMADVKELTGLRVVGRRDLHVVEMSKENIQIPCNFSSSGYNTGLNCHI